jgi:hypothetical protein
MDSITLPFRALLDPVGGVRLAVEGRRWFVPLLLLCVLTAASGAVIALRLDASRVVIPKLQMTGELLKASEREISEQIEQAQRIALVGGIARGVLLMPLVVLLLAVALKIVAWLTARKVLFVEAFTITALAMLPFAVLHAIELAAALKNPVLTPAMIEGLVPTSLLALKEASGPALTGLFKALDVINLWAALLFGLGFAAASQWAPWKGALLALFVYALFASAVFIGVPGVSSGMAGGMGAHP